MQNLDPYFASLDKNDHASALAFLEQAAHAGHPDAEYQLALHCLAGDLVTRDLARARALLRRAIARHHIEATRLEVALLANGSGAPTNWGTARTLLDTVRSVDPVAAGQAALVDAMDIDERGYPVHPPTGRTLSDSPRIVHFSQLLTPQECEHVARAAIPLLGPSTVADPRTGQLRLHPIRTSHDAILGPAREDLVIAAITRRIAAISNTQRSAGEPLTILHYAPGQEYRPHLDTLPQEDNQRTHTVILYLNSGYAGGATHFPVPDIRFTAKIGDALMFDTCLPDGAPDPNAVHAGEPVVNGTKWVATRWIRRHPLNLWQSRSN